MEGASNPSPLDDKIDDFVISIDREIKSIPPNHSEAYIFKVNDLLRQKNSKSYAPAILAIGPYNYHLGKNKLKAMQEHKLRYLQLLLQRTDELSVDRYITAMRNMEEKVRRCYGSPVNLERDDFVKMMLLDGCFIIELFRKLDSSKLRDKDDPIFKMSWIHSTLQRDLMLFENQLPFFVLVELFKMTKDFNYDDNKIITMAQKFLFELLPGPFVFKDPNPSTISHVDHLLGLMHDYWCPSPAEIVPDGNDGNAGNELELINSVVEVEEAGNAGNELELINSFVELKEVGNAGNELELINSFVELEEAGNARNELEFIKSVVELEEAGIEFKKPKKCSSLFSIKFEKGIMEIPPLRIEDRTEHVFRNLIVYEQYRDSYPRLVTDYTTFIDCLINSAKDVEKLRQYGIIDNWLGDDKAISTMFNKLGDNIFVHSDSYSYFEVFNNVNKHCMRRRNIWLANLRRNYFNTPWAIISFLAGVVLLLLTIVQTIFSII